MSNTPLLGSFSDVGGSSLMFRNALINGNFDIWQRGTSQTASGYGSDDRWLNDNNNSSKTHTRQTFALGQTDVPGNPKYFSRTVVSSLAGSSNYTLKLQRIEDVKTYAGRPVTLSFWAKADAAKNIATEFCQQFGSGGSPSSPVESIGVTTFSLTTNWKYFTTTVNIPSISGKTLGTGNNDYLQLIFWFEAGSNFNARTNSLGQQSGTFDIAQVQLEAGPVATPFEQRPIGLELSLCQRYYEVLSWGYFDFTLTSRNDGNVLFPMSWAPKRAAPSSVSFAPASWNYLTQTNSGTMTMQYSSADTRGCRIYAVITGNWVPVEISNGTTTTITINSEL